MATTAKFIWTDSEGRGWNRWALFGTSFEPAGAPAGGCLNVLADTRYRLILNPAEHLDARLMPQGWEQSDFDDSGGPQAVARAAAERTEPITGRGRV